MHLHTKVLFYCSYYYCALCIQKQFHLSIHFCLAHCWFYSHCLSSNEHIQNDMNGNKVLLNYPDSVDNVELRQTVQEQEPWGEMTIGRTTQRQQAWGAMRLEQNLVRQRQESPSGPQESFPNIMLLPPDDEMWSLVDHGSNLSGCTQGH